MIILRLLLRMSQKQKSLEGTEKKWPSSLEPYINSYHEIKGPTPLNAQIHLKLLEWFKTKKLHIVGFSAILIISHYSQIKTILNSQWYYNILSLLLYMKTLSYIFSSNYAHFRIMWNMASCWFRRNLILLNRKNIWF